MKTPPATHPVRRNPAVTLAEPKPDDQCYICERSRRDIPSELAWLFQRWACRDRVDCYSVWRRHQ